MPAGGCSNACAGACTKQASEQSPFVTSRDRSDDGADTRSAANLFEIAIGVAISFVSDRTAVQAITPPFNLDGRQANCEVARVVKTVASSRICDAAAQRCASARQQLIVDNQIACQ